MQGVFIKGARPSSKAAIKRALADPEVGAERIRIEATSWHGNEYDGLLSQAPVGSRFAVVGPDPHTKRNFYGTIAVTPAGIKVT